MDDITALNIDRPEIIVKATEHIPQMLEMVEKLADDGYAYELSDGVYFDISKFDGYGKLSRLDLDEQLAGARVEINPEKRHPADFALWIKAPKEHIMQWESRWGAGYPGWHIECSAMSTHYLGNEIDIHTGGVDHIPIHHENEIAQSDAYAGKRVVNIWMHNEFLLIDNGKMSKSLRNMYVLADIKARGYNPLVYRYFCLNGHYRNKLNFTWDGMRSAAVSYRRYIEGALAHRDARDEDPEPSYLEGMTEAFEAAVNDDLNIPKALGIAWQLVRNPNKSNSIYELLLDMDDIFGLALKEAGSEISGAGRYGAAAPEADDEVPQDIMDIVYERDAARAAKDWKKSDELRELIKNKGYAVLDSKQGSKIEKIIS
jgi:cysteinyl-tRNA synthetase